MTGLRVVLVSTRNPLNIGAAARAMSNFGFLELALVGAYDVAFREAKSAVGASAVMEAAREYASVAEAVADCTLVVGTTAASRRELRHSIRRLEYGGRLIRKHAGKVALLFGSEKSGLSNDDLSHCHWLMHIPSRTEHRSMNLGQAVAVCLYELVRDSKKARVEPERRKPAPSADAERLVERLHEILELSGYYEGSAAGGLVRLRHLVRRMSLNTHDAEVWMGILRQVLWRLKTPER